MCRVSLAAVLLATAVPLVSVAGDPAAHVSFSREADGVTVLIDGELFTRYVTCSGTRPVLWPVIGPTGEQMTRAYPVATRRRGEATDHVHHRSIWVGYEGLGGVDFWHEPATRYDGLFDTGKTVHRGFRVVESRGATGTIVTDNDWVDALGKPVCSDRRTLVFGSDGDQRWIDYQVEMFASEGPLEISDSKEGFVAVRVAPSVRVDANAGGTIINSRGDTDAEAWSRRAEWVDYHGPVGGETVGIAILSHPRSFEASPRWHVRPYGLFAANPLGEVAFTDPSSDLSKRGLRLTLPAGESLRFRYKIILHRGDDTQADIAGQYAAFAGRRAHQPEE